MKKNLVRVVKKSTLNAVAAAPAQPQSSVNQRGDSPRSVAHRISNNVMGWVDELRERKTIEATRSFNLLAKVGR